MVSTTWQYRQSDAAIALREAARELNDLQDALYELPGVASRVAEDVGLSFSQREYTFFVRTGVAGTVDDPLLAGWVSAVSTANAVPDAYTIDAPGRAGWELTQSGALQYVGLPLSDDMAAFALDITATLGADLEAHARVYVISENLSPFRPRSGEGTDVWQFTKLLDYTSPGSVGTVSFTGIRENDLRQTTVADSAVGNRLGQPLWYRRPPPYSQTQAFEVRSWTLGGRAIGIELGDFFISEDTTATYTYGVESSVPSIVETMIVRNPNIDSGFVLAGYDRNVDAELLTMLMLQPRMRGNSSVSLYAIDGEGAIAGGLTFHYESDSHPDAGSIGADDYQSRPALLQPFPTKIRMPVSENISIPLSNYFSLSRYGVPPISLVWNIKLWGTVYRANVPDAESDAYWYRKGYRPSNIRTDSRTFGRVLHVREQSSETAINYFTTTANISMQVTETHVLNIRTGDSAAGNWMVGAAVTANTIGEDARWSPMQSFPLEIITGLGFTQDIYHFTLPAGQTGTPTAYELGTVTAWGNNVSYRIGEGDATKFAYNSSTGRFDYIGSGESADERDTVFRLQVVAQQGTDANDTDTAEVIVTVVGDYEYPIRFEQDRYIFEIPENTTPYTDTDWQITASSVVVGESPTIVYRSTNPDVLYSETGVVSYDGEGLAGGESVQTTLTATAGSGPNRQQASTILEIRAVSSNRKAPTISFIGTPYRFTLPEGQSGISAEPLGTLAARASDSTAVVRFGIATEGVPFGANAITGEMRYTGLGEIYDNRRVWHFQAVATTAATATLLPGRQFVYVRVDITRDANLPPEPVFSQDSYSFSAPSGTAGTTIGIPVGYTPASGPDVGYTVSIPVGETDTNWSSSSDALLTYRGPARAAGTEVELLILAETNSSDSDVGQRGRAEVPVTVTFGAGVQSLQTIEWPSTNVTNGRYEFSAEENTTTPITLATILPTVSAPAGSTAGALTLTRGGPDSDRFTWSAAGVLEVTGALDYDTKQVYTVLLTATAAETTTARETVSNRWVRLTLTEDDMDVVPAPTFAEDSYQLELPAGADGSTTAIRLGQIAAAAPEGNITYAITLGDTAKFAIDESSGEVTYIGTGETDGSNFAITVTATATLGAMSASASVVARISTVATTQAAVTITSADAPAAIFVIPSDTDGRTTPVYIGTIPFTAASTAGVAAIGAWSYEIDNANLTATARGSTALIHYVGPAMAAGSNTINTTITATTASTARAEAGSYTLRLIATFADEMPLFARAAYEFTLSSEADGSTTPVEVGTVTATPVESYAMVLGDTSLFAVDASTGVITYLGTAAALTATDTRTIQIQATNATETATANVLITVKSPVTVSFVPAAPAWSLAENTAGPVVLGSLMVRTVSADINGLPSAPSLVAGGADGRFIGIVSTAHNRFTISYTGAARTTALNFTLTATCAENGTALEADAVLTVGAPVVPATPLLSAASYSYVLPDGTDPPPVYALGSPAILNAVGYSQRWRIVTAQTGQRLFAIDAATGALTYDGPAAADRDVESSYTLQVGVVNQRDALSSAEATATVTVGVPVSYSAPVRNAGWSPGAGWTASADGSWHRTMTASQVVAVDITAGATGPYTIQSGLTANYRNSTAPSPATDFSVVRSDGVFTITASATETGSETLYLYLSDGTTEEQLDFHIQVVSSATTTATDVVWYQDDGAGYSAIGSRGVTINFAEGAAGQVATNIYAAYTNIQNRTNASLDEPTLTGFDIITQTSPRRQIQVGSQMIWIDAYTINIDPTQFDYETQSAYDLTATLNVPAYTAGSTTWAAAHKPLRLHLRVGDINEPPARTALATPNDFGLRQQGAIVQFSLAVFWVDPEGRTLSYRLTQRVVGASGGQSTTPSDYLSASIIGSDFQASAGQTALVTPTGVTIEFSVEAYDGTQYSAPMTFSCDEVHGRALEDSPLAWSSGLPERLVWQVAENIAVPYVLRNDIYATSTVTDLTATAGALTYTLEEATYYPVRNTAYQFANNAPSLDAGATLDIDLTNAFVIEGSDKAGKDFTITATSSNTAALTITVAGKTATLTAANNLSAEGSSTFTLIAHAGGFVAQYVGVATIAAARPAITVKTPLGAVDAAITGAGTQTSPWIPPRRWIAIATDAMFEADSMVDIYSVTVGTTTITPFNDQGFSTTGDVNSLQFGMVAWVLWVNSSSSTAQEVTVRGRLRSDNTATATATVWIQ